LSNADDLRLRQLAKAPRLAKTASGRQQRAQLYALGPAAWADAVHLSWARSRASKTDAEWRRLLRLPQRWKIPACPVSGNDLLATGLVSGPAIGRALTELEQQWTKSDFTLTKTDLLRHLNTFREAS
jgi:poly(A) polymerase